MAFSTVFSRSVVNFTASPWGPFNLEELPSRARNMPSFLKLTSHHQNICVFTKLMCWSPELYGDSVRMLGLWWGMGRVFMNGIGEHFCTRDLNPLWSWWEPQMDAHESRRGDSKTKRQDFSSNCFCQPPDLGFHSIQHVEK